MSQQNEHEFKEQFLRIEFAMKSGLISPEMALTRAALLGTCYQCSAETRAVARLMAMAGIP